MRFLWLKKRPLKVFLLQFFCGQKGQLIIVSSVAVQGAFLLDNVANFHDQKCLLSQNS